MEEKNMVMKIVTYNGTNLLSDSELDQNFEINTNTLSFVKPILQGDIEVGIANNIFKAIDSTQPDWKNTQIRYKATGLKDQINEILEYKDRMDLEIKNKYELYGFTDVGTTNLLYQMNIPNTDGNIDYIQVDLSESQATNPTTPLSGIHELTYNLNIVMPKFNINYESITLKYNWYDTGFLNRVSMPITCTLQQTHGWTPPTHTSEPISGYMHQGWYIILPIAYREGMLDDFGDVAFTGPDGTSLLHHTILSVSTQQIDNVDVKYAYALIIIPYTFGYLQTETLQYPPNTSGYKGNYGSTPYIGFYSNSNPQYIWMYYNNQYEPILEDIESIRSGVNGTYFFDTFQLLETQEETWNKKDYPDTDANIDLGTIDTPQMQLKINSGVQKEIYAITNDLNIKNESYDVIWDITKLKTQNTDPTNAYGELWLQDEKRTKSVGLIFKDSKIYVKMFTLENNTPQTYYFDLGDGLNIDQYNSGTHNVYIRARVHANYTEYGLKGISFARSETGRVWQEIITFIQGNSYTTEDEKNITFTLDVNTLNKVGVGLNTTNSLDFDILFWIDFILVQQHHTIINQYNAFEDSFDFSDISPTFTLKNITSKKSYKVDNISKTVQMELKGDSAMYNSGKWESPTIYLQKEEKNSSITRGIQFNQNYGVVTIETKIVRHKRTGGNITRATLYLGKDNTKHFNIFHQQSSDPNTNQTMGCISTIDSKDTILGKQHGPVIPDIDELSVEHVWMRIICHLSLGKIIGEYSTNGIDWITIGIDNINNYTDCHETGITLANTGYGTGTCNFDYFKVYTGVSTTTKMSEEVQTQDSQEGITQYPEYYIYSDSFEDNPTIQNNQLSPRAYPYRPYTSYAGEMKIIEQDGTYALQHTGNSKYTSNNLILFEDGSIDYTVEFDFNIVSMSKTSTQNNSINLWVLKSANDGLTYVTVSLSFKNNNTTSISLINYNLGESAWITDETFLKNNLTTEKLYHFQIDDNGQKVSITLDGIPIMKDIPYLTTTQTTPLIIPPGYSKGFGCNEKNVATWTNLKIIPNNISPEFFGKSNHFILHPSFIRNQPIHLEYVEQGGGIRYSQTTYPNAGGIFLVGPADLTHYTGLITRITIEGNSDTNMEISGIDYQYIP